MSKAVSQSSGHASSTVVSIMEEAALEMGRHFRVCEFEFFVGLEGDLGLDWSLGLSGTYLRFKKMG